MTSGRCRTVVTLLAILLVFLPIHARAQTGTASITGLVLDETGGALPGVTVTATNQATNVDYMAVTNEAGNYTITPVTVGLYVIRAELAGFRTATTPAVTLEARQVARLDFKMAVGAVAETIQVTGVAPILQTETSSVGEVVSGTTVQSLPLNGRNTGQLTLLLPGTITYNPRGFTNIGSVNMNRPFVNGNREQTNNFTVDGLDVNETIDNRVSYQPIPDALAEISVETNNYAADVGNVGGAVINSVVKSGANQFHGNAFEFYRNSRSVAASSPTRCSFLPTTRGRVTTLRDLPPHRSRRRLGATAIFRASVRKSETRERVCRFQETRSRPIGSARPRAPS